VLFDRKYAPLKKSIDMKKIFQSLSLGTVEIPNRVALAPMDLGFFTVDETWSNRYLRFIEERCIGEVGLVITHFTCATQVTPEKIVGSYDDRFLGTHRKMTELVHRYESKIFLQIAASGGEVGNAAPSSIESPRYPEVPRELTLEEIDLIIRDFAHAAARAREAGYDGVELHAAHTYLIGAFISPHTNRRKDKYGGDFEGRMLLPVEIVRAVKDKAGDDFPVGFKFSAWEELEGGVGPELGIQIAVRMAKEKVCYLHVSSTSATLGVSSKKYSSVPTMFSPRNTLLPLAQMVKKAVPDVPVMATGAINEPHEVEEMITRGDCDSVALGRALLADPHWVRKARLAKQIRPCIRCNVCYQQIYVPNSTAICTVNPYLTLEEQEPLPPIGKQKRIMVAGGGPAGIVAALTADFRGHRVALYEKKGALGGMLFPASRPDFKAEIRRLLRYWLDQLSESRVKIHLNAEVSYDLVRRERPDALIIAIGAVPIMPAIAGINGRNVFDAVDILENPGKIKGNKILILGGGDVGCECAIFLARRGYSVTVVEELDELLVKQDVYTVKVDLIRMVEEEGVQIQTGASAIEIAEDTVRLRLRDGTERAVRSDSVVVAVGMAPLRKKCHELAGECPDVRVVGDCLEPRRILDAVLEGDLAGRLV
jgi:2,4-dienoyl-CoA reductase-like NADH-dependent reductase (Old Yellow Enzyme family)/thioredoxin reductase